MNLSEMKKKRDDVLAQATDLSQAHTDDWSDTHQSELDQMMAEVKDLNAQIAAKEQANHQASQARMQLIADRRAEASAQANLNTNLTATDRIERALGRQQQGATGVEPPPKKQIFASFGEQLQAICVAGLSSQGNYADPRLFEVQGLATGSSGRVATEGGYLIEKQTAQGLWQRTYENGQALSRCFRVPISGDRDGLIINALAESSRATGSRWGGVRVYRIGEAETITASKPKLRQMVLQLKGIAGAWYVTDNMLKDASAMEAIARETFSSEMAFVIENEIFNGTGGSQMLGINNSACRVSVTRSGSNAFAKADVDNMYARLWSRSLVSSKTAWFIHQTMLPKILALESSNGFPLFQPPAGMSATPYGTLYGLPVIPMECMQTLGTVGDVMLADMSQYVIIDKGGVTSDSSIHLRFLEEETVFKWSARNDGQPMWDAALTPANGSVTTSPFVVLAS